MENTQQNAAHEAELNQLKDKVSNKQPNLPPRKLDYEEGNKMVGWLERLTNIISTYGMKRVLQAFLLVIMCLMLLLFVNAMYNQSTMDKVIAKTEEVLTKKLSSEETDHEIGTTSRREVTPKISKTLIKMLYELEADRACILEMHNGKENPTSLPFDFSDMTYEETRGKIPYIADEYEDLNMSKFTFPEYLYQHRTFIGSIEEIYEIDKKLAMRLEMNNVQYAGIILIRTNTDIGFLMVSYTHEPTLSREDIYAELTYYVQEIGTYLDYIKQLELRTKTQA